MLRDNDTARQDQDDQNATENKASSKPNAYRVDDDDNLEEKDLITHYLFGKGEMKDINAQGMEGQGMGGQQFGENNLTPAGNDKANPPQNAGEGNAYFRRTEPLEEHPENSNFKPQDQQGKPDYSNAQPNIPGPNELPDQQKVGEDNPSANQSQKTQEGTADSDGPKKDQDHIET